MLMDATREGLPDTMAVVRLSAMEISDLTMELNDNAKKNFISQIDNEIQRRPDFTWRKIDWHMETYVGKKGSEWDIGFSARSVKIPHILRGRYCYTMISSIYNNQRSPMLQLAHDWIEANMDKLLELNNKYTELFSRRKKK
ncbi:hypothetical protein SASPL_141166 [Salvia splendens]|uniref:Uncharacterized protein n=1 Tax=Salvia splendens TaxID=180675 RepID=A0A8X8WRP1_SALSN|nr:hypothetical protein SASPL_141166 [Salvia splendens]